MCERSFVTDTDNGIGLTVAAENDKHVARHVGLLVVSKLYHASGFKFFDSKFNHFDCTVDDSMAGRDLGNRLLPLQHRFGNFRRITQVANAGFDHSDASANKAFVQLVHQLTLDFLLASPQGQGFLVVFVEGIIREQARKMADCCLRFQFDEFVIVFDVKEGLVGVVNLPNEHDSDFDRVPALVIYGDRIELFIHSLERHAALSVERIRPKKTMVFDSSLVCSKKHHDTCFVRVDLKHSFH